MSTLSNLKLVTTKKPTHMPAIVVRRHKLSKKNMGANPNG